MTLDLPGLARRARERLPGVLFITVSGAHLYGFPSDDSDVDLRGSVRVGSILISEMTIAGD